MNNLLQTLQTTYQQNPASALSLLPDLFQAVEGGKIIELPCKVGDTVYWASNFGKAIHHGKITAVKISCFGIDLEMETPANLLFKREAERVFLTREVAEQVLKERDA